MLQGSQLPRLTRSNYDYVIDFFSIPQQGRRRKMLLQPVTVLNGASFPVINLARDSFLNSRDFMEKVCMPSMIRLTREKAFTKIQFGLDYFLRYGRIL